MSVDMFERRFREELTKLPEFVPSGKRDPRVWRMGFPAWHALFSAMSLFGHSTGYRLFSYEEFFDYCRRAYAVRHREAERFKPYFEAPLLEGMQQRVSVWYESGMAELYLYACLVEAIEDKMKTGLVLYDPRADWKLKADVIVILRKTPMRISAYFGDEADRPALEVQRDATERSRKEKTPESSHWGNSELEAMRCFEISQKSVADTQDVNGVRLPSLPLVNGLLARIYEHANVSDGHLFHNGQSKRK